MVDSIEHATPPVATHHQLTDEDQQRAKEMAHEEELRMFLTQFEPHRNVSPV